VFLAVWRLGTAAQVLANPVAVAPDEARRAKASAVALFRRHDEPLPRAALESKERQNVSEKKATQKTERIGIELPFGWCLVRGERLRQLQKDLREARFDVMLRSRMCANLLKQLYRKESR